MVTSNFRAWVVDKKEKGFTAQVHSLAMRELPEGDVTIRVQWSGINYKDGLASIPKGRIVTSYPMVPGIDLAGTVVHSDNQHFQVGDEVIAASAELGVSHYGGLSEVARVPGTWLIPCPEGLTLRETMILGTAGFTAAMSIERLEENGLSPGDGTVLVTGATGGVGSTAVAMLAKRGYRVAAATGKEKEHSFLRQLGAQEILSRAEINPEKKGPLLKARFAAAVDPVGGDSLSFLLSSLSQGGSVALSGLTGGTNFQASVFPFILRGVNVLGIDSAHISNTYRRKIWKRLGSDLKPQELLDTIHSQEIRLEDLPHTLPRILRGETRGRVLVKLFE